jgi:hypothetical protein
MNKNDYPKAGLQRLFQKGADNFVLLHKNGKAVAFQSNQNGDVNIIDRQTDIDFSSTGLSLLDDGWKCVGPGLQYSWLFEPPRSTIPFF